MFDRNRPGFEEDMKRKFDVEYGLQFFETFFKEQNKLSELGLNILDKLYAYAPQDKRVMEYINALL